MREPGTALADAGKLDVTGAVPLEYCPFAPLTKLRKSDALHAAAGFPAWGHRSWRQSSQYTTDIICQEELVTYETHKVDENE